MSSFSISSSNSYRKKWKNYKKLIIFNIHGVYKIFRSYQLLILYIFLISTERAKCSILKMFYLQLMMISK